MALSQSFNLRPAVMDRPNVQGPRTNLRVAAVLQKASNILQVCLPFDSVHKLNQMIASEASLRQACCLSLSVFLFFWCVVFVFGGRGRDQIYHNIQ